MRYNIYKLYLIKIAKWFSLVMPIVVLFYYDNGLEQFDVLLLQGIYSIAIIAIEIPSGYLADVLGRKKTLVSGAILGTIGFAIYSQSHGFIGFLIAELTLGFGQSLISGADSAMLYDSLLAQKREKKYLKFEGQMTSIGNFAEALAGISGGFLAAISLRTPYYFQTAVAFMAIPAALTLIEPYREKTIKKMQFKDIVDIFKIAIIKDKKLRYPIIFSALIGSGTLSMAWFVQPYFIEVNLSPALFGILWALLNLSVALTSLLAHKIDRILKQTQVFFLITIFVSGLYFLTGIYQTYWGISLLFVFYLVRGLATPLLKDYINKKTDSNIRATVLSVRNFIIRFIFAGVGPFLGWITDHYTLSTALVMAGIFYLITGLFLITVLRK